MRFLVGTYTRETDSDGIYHLVLDQDYEVKELLLATNADNPSWLVLHPSLSTVYAVNEVGDFGGDGGAISTYQLDGASLDLVSQVPSLGKDPCHLTVLDRGDAIVATNYTSGSVTSYPLDQEGVPGNFESFIQHRGSGPDPMRQKSAHAHSSIVVNDQVIVADLGTDQLVSYAMGPSGSLDVTRMKRYRLTPGAGPRHMVHDSALAYLYVICELDNTIVSFAVADTLTELGSASTLPSDYTDASYTAQILISRDDRFIYGSNRGHNSIVVFEVLPEGELKLVQHIPTAGDHPRHFVLSPDESHLIVANRDSNNLVVFSRDMESGLLTGLDQQIEIPAPVCVLPLN